MAMPFDLEPHYTWLVIGLVLAVAEMAIPGVFLIWMAGAALATGMLTWMVAIELPAQVSIFSVLSILAVFAGRKYLARHPVVAADPLMNQRGARAVGESVVVTEAIVGGSGRVRLGDSEWMARGEDAALGTRLRVTAVDGSVLLVSVPPA
ncbi:MULTISPECIES: NfeD family protein [unclassified Novosphingobium]|uniref:NfeD family protein n=1 Tax=unclassified Novosphingobium TaxID=2644732 RepID=UPI001359F928|nr:MULTISPECIES: NfeD family protein [unclassified Novosphingobium]